MSTSGVECLEGEQEPFPSPHLTPHTHTDVKTTRYAHTQLDVRLSEMVGDA